ncbi:MAG: L,D-transpeptidase [Firmicutes bacterium]|nr:L,D-transpeptidase [Bacillota bacterium]
MPVWVLVLDLVLASVLVVVLVRQGSAGGRWVGTAVAGGGARTAESRSTRAEVFPGDAELFPGDFLLLNLPSLRLQVWRDGLLRGCYPVAIGKPSEPTPTGIYHIVARRMHPTWYPPEGGPPVPPGPENPLGSRFFALSLAGYGLHGTNAPGSIGKAVSRGCVRLSERDVALLWRWAYPTLPLRIVYERVVVDPASWGATLMVWPDPYRRMEVRPHLVAELCAWPEEALPLAQDALGWTGEGPVLLSVAAPARAEAELRLLVEGPWLGEKGVGHEVSN